MALRSMTVHRYEEIRRDWLKGAGCARSRVLWDVRVAQCAKCATVNASRRCTEGAQRSAVDESARLADDHPRSGAGSSAEVPVGGEGAEPHHLQQLLEAVLRKFPQYREASVTAREFAPGERVEVDYAGEPIEWVEIKSGRSAKPGSLSRAWASASCCLPGGRGHEEPQLAWMSSTHVRLLRGRCARDSAGLLEARRAQVSSVRSGSEPGYAELATQFATTVVPARGEKTEG